LAEGCSRYVPPPPSKSVANETIPIRGSCPSNNSEDYYFPPGKLAPTDIRLDEIMRISVSKMLLARGESSLSCGSPGEVYRFIWGRAFDNEVLIRVTNKPEGAVIYALEFTKSDIQDEEYDIVRSIERTLSPAELESLSSKFYAFNEIPSWDGSSGIDGSTWIIERSVESEYQVAYRWYAESGVVREIGLQFMSLTGWDFDEIY
jgi:hypothetical protein